jgi:hypothetical protein
MSFLAGRRPPVNNLATCTLVLVIALLTIGMPVGDLCCVPSSPCCADTLQQDRPEMRAPLEGCCQSIVSNDVPAPKVRLAARPDGIHPVMVPIISAVSGDLSASSNTPGPAVDPRPGLPPPTRACRAPPLS